MTYAKKLPKAIAIGVIGLGIGAFGAMPDAHATLQLSSIVNGSPLNCTDGAACDGNAATGVLALGTAGSVTIGGVRINGSISNSDLASAILNSSSLSVINFNPFAVTIRVAVSDVNFIGPRVGYAFSGSGTFQNAVGATITNTWWNDPGNTQGANTPTDLPGNQLDVTRSHTSTAVVDSYSFNQPLSLLPAADLGNFGMSLGFEFTLPGSTNPLCTSLATSTCAQLISRGQTELKFTDAPEPSSIALLGAALLGMCAMRGKKRRVHGMVASS